MTRLDQAEQKSAEMCGLLNQEKERLWFLEVQQVARAVGVGDTQEPRTATT